MKEKRSRPRGGGFDSTVHSHSDRLGGAITTTSTTAATATTSGTGPYRHADPLADQLVHDAQVNENDRGRSRRARTTKAAHDADDDAEQMASRVSERLSRRILDQAREQQEEIEREERGKGSVSQQQRQQQQQRGRRHHHDKDEDEEDEEEERDGEYNYLGTEQDYLQDVDEELRNISKEDERILRMFMPAKAEERRTLADILHDKMRQKEEEMTAIASESQPSKLNPKIVEVYTQVGKLLARYKSGKLPKAFKLVPTMADWEEILYITGPESWSPQATYQATRIFASSFSPKMAQRFYNLILLPKVRDDFHKQKTLNYHLYMALKKALYKPAAFFKGILLPLCEAGNCTLSEAAIIASILKKVSIPILHSSAALLKLAEMEYTGTNSIFLRVLMDKKYALPYRVIDALVFHFLAFENDARQMPVLWHQAFLVFVQRYKEDLTPEQKEALRNLLRKQSHEKITPEIRREIDNSKCRGDIVSEEPLAFEGSVMDTDDQMEL